MRIGLLIGILLLALGTWIVSGRATYSTKKAEVDIGVLQANVREEQVIPRWIGFVALGAGVLVLVGSRRPVLSLASDQVPSSSGENGSTDCRGKFDHCKQSLWKEVVFT